MKKIIAKEVNPAHVDFSYYFDDDGLKGENNDRKHNCILSESCLYMRQLR